MSRDALTRAGKMVALVVGLLTLLAMGYSGSIVVTRDLLGFETQKSHDRDIARIERKLDCALFQLPLNCREHIGPRTP